MILFREQVYFIVNQVSCRFIKLIRSMYSGLHSDAKLSCGITPFFESLIGVRQGCNLNPMLFNLFLNDLPEIFDSKCDPVRICNTELSCLLYSDHLLILSEAETGLRASINKLHSYAKKWQLNVNIKKTKIMVFSKMGRHYPLAILLGNRIINSCLEYDYLGMTFTPSGSFKLARESLCKKARKAYCSFLNGINIQLGTQISTIKKAIPHFGETNTVIQL